MCVIGVYQYFKWSKQPSSNMSYDQPITYEPTTDGILIIKDFTFAPDFNIRKKKKIKTKLSAFSAESVVDMQNVNKV